MPQCKRESTQLTALVNEIASDLGVSYSTFERLLDSFYTKKSFNVLQLKNQKTEDYFKRLLSNETNCLREHFELKDCGCCHTSA
jgi:hypothetical protein